MNEPVPQSETVNLPDNSKKISSPTQPKSLQQEFSLINMNIPNIEVTWEITLREMQIDEATNATWCFVPGKRDGRDGEELYDNRVYKELQCDIKSKFSRELSVQRAAYLSILFRHIDRQRDDDQIAEGSPANRSASRQEEQIVLGTVSSAANYNSGTSEQIFVFFFFFLSD